MLKREGIIKCLNSIKIYFLLYINKKKYIFLFFGLFSFFLDHFKAFFLEEYKPLIRNIYEPLFKIPR